MHFSAIVNLASGSVPPEGDRLLQEEVSRLGHSVEVHVVNGAELVDVWANVDAETSDGVLRKKENKKYKRLTKNER